VRDVVAQLHVLDDLGQGQHPGPGPPRQPVSAGEQRNSSAGGQPALELDGSPHIAGIALPARLLDIGADGVELGRELLDVLGGQVGVFLDVGDRH
jgi:hypothetical protein